MYLNNVNIWGMEKIFLLEKLSPKNIIGRLQDKGQLWWVTLYKTLHWQLGKYKCF